MKVYLFGNEDHPQDNAAFEVISQIMEDESIPHEEKRIYNSIGFVVVKPNQDLPFDKGEDVILMDTVKGLPKVTLLTEEDFLKIKLPPRTSVHDFDLGFQLKYLKRLGKIGEVKIIGLPLEGNIDLNVLHVIFSDLTSI